MATKHTSKCLAKAADNEPIFVLRAQDKLAPIVIREWASLARFADVPKHKIEAALKTAAEMEQWPNRKLPD